MDRASSSAGSQAGAHRGNQTIAQMAGLARKPSLTACGTRSLASRLPPEATSSAWACAQMPRQFIAE